MDTKKLQKEVLQNKINHGFPVGNLDSEFCLAHGELSEAYIAWIKGQDDVGEELADVAIYLLGIAEMLNIDLGKEIVSKIEKNKKRIYKKNSKGIFVKEDELV